MRFLKTIFPYAAALLFVVLLVLAAPSCGRSDLAKQYEAYEAQVEPLLDREMPVWKKVVTLFNEQRSEETVNQARFKGCVQNETLPFYTEFESKVGQVKAPNPELAAAQELLVKYAAARLAFARHLSENTDVMDPGAGEEALAKRTSAAKEAAELYEKETEGSDVKDPRFGALAGIERAFAEKCMKPFAEGRMSADDVDQFIRKGILPQIESLRSEKFGEDRASQLLKRAIVAAGELYTTVAASLPVMDRQVRFAAEVGRRTKDGDDLLTKFREAMAAIRRRM